MDVDHERELYFLVQGPQESGLELPVSCGERKQGHTGGRPSLCASSVRAFRVFAVF